MSTSAHSQGLSAVVHNRLRRHDETNTALGGFDMNTALPHPPLTQRDDGGQRSVAATTATEAPVVITRRRVDRLLISAGVLFTGVLAAAGGLLTWGSRFADDYVQRELSSQQIFFPAADALTAEGRTDLLSHAGDKVTSGSEAEVYAGYIKHHLDGVAGGKTYADLGTPERAAKAELKTAKEAGASEAQLATLKTTADGLTAQRDTLFRGETLRGLLLTTYAWATMGTIATIAAVVSFIAAALMAIFVALGVLHLRHSKLLPATIR
jgi:hypothetical protein